MSLDTIAGWRAPGRVLILKLVAGALRHLLAAVFIRNELGAAPCLAHFWLADPLHLLSTAGVSVVVRPPCVSRHIP